MSPSCLVLTAVCLAVQPAPDVLCDRTRFVHPADRPGWATYRQLESADAARPGGIYGLSAITVPEAGWHIEAVTIFTTARAPEKWAALDKARFNVFPKGKADTPTADDDPRAGKAVAVTVREVKDGIFAVRASGLDRRLDPGDYWIGLTPIYDAAKHGQGMHVVVGAVRDARYDDAVRSPDGDRGTMPFLKDWNELGPRVFAPVNEHLSIRVEGRRLHRGRMIDLPAAPPEKAKKVHLRFAAFDPLVGEPAVPADRRAAPTGRLWIVQARGAVDGPFRDALAKAGAVPLAYLPDDAYVVRLDPDKVEAVRKLDAVRWVGPYHPAYRIEAGVFPEPKADSFGRTLPVGEPAGMRQVRVFLFDRADAAKKSVAKVVNDAGGAVLFTSAKGKYLVAHVPLGKVAVVAGADEVAAVERVAQGFTPQQITRDVYGGEKARITMAQVRELCGADRLKAAGYDGYGVKVAFWDDGVRADHADLLARPLTILGTMPRGNWNHGTAIAGILCGEGRLDARARGLLPAGGLVFASRKDNASHDGYDLMDRFVHEHRAAAFSDSSGGWGGEDVTWYDGYATVLDDWVLTHDLLACVAIGNDRPESGQSGSWAKNVVCVGGVHPHGSVKRDDHRPLNATSGPAPDGRVKPDLVHFGYGVFTTHASGPRNYENFAGTSCATPVTAGHFGLLMEAWADGAFGTRPAGKTVADRKPHAATAKALLVGSAFRYPTDGEKPAFPRFRQGWGMADLGRVWDVRDRLFVIDEELPLPAGRGVEYALTVAEGEPELRATLAWTDPVAATTAAKALVNDLDLTVTAPDGTVYRGNVGLLTANESSPGGEADRVNNVENVFVGKPTPGVWKVVVGAHRVAIDQHAATAGFDQTFGLAVSGVRPK